MIKAPGPGEIEFYDNVLPVIPAHEYDLVVTQSVEVSRSVIAPAYEHVQSLRVTGPHLGLEPEDVTGVYPPANGQDDYGATLPHVVLGRRTLPWDVFIDPPTRGPVVTPWLALLLLVPGEWEPVSDALTGTRSVRLADYLRPPDGVVGPDFTPAHVTELEQDNPDRWVVVIDVGLEAFRAVAPERGELPFLAHARQVDVEAQEISETGSDGWFSVVVANRLPEGSPDGTYVAHLVSVEGFVDYLPGSGWTPPPGTRAVRMLSLASWAFNSLPGASSFAALMSRLDNGVLRLPAERLLPTSATEPERDVRKALDLGYTGLRYETRLGAATVGWYRGPCLPVPMKPNPQEYDAAEAALIYAQQTGMFDLSFAVAWQTGRLVALADQQLGDVLIEWLRGKLQLAHLLCERLRRAEEHAFDFPDDPVALAAPDLLRRLAVRALARTWARRLVPADPTRPPLLGAPRDPSGLAALRHRLPGLLPPEALGAVVGAGGNPTLALLERLRRGR